VHALSGTESLQEILSALSESDCRPSLHTVRLRSRRFYVADALPETPRSNDFTETRPLELKYQPVQRKSLPEGEFWTSTKSAGLLLFRRLFGLPQTMF
jgi:hypothetical protein